MIIVLKQYKVKAIFMKQTSDFNNPTQTTQRSQHRFFCHRLRWRGGFLSVA